jgi:RES domain-containing protein
VLLVPSVVFDVERNARINPMHRDFAQVHVLDISPVRWDARLFEPAS